MNFTLRKATTITWFEKTATNTSKKKVKVIKIAYHNARSEENINNQSIRNAATKPKEYGIWIEGDC